MKWLLRALVVLVVLLVAVDFGAKLLVENLASRALSNRRGVNGSVDVSFGGFPFLLALKDRRFGNVTIEADDVRSGGFMTASAPSPQSEVRMDSVRLELEDVAVSGQVWRDDGDGRVSATSGGGSAVLSQSALNKMVPPEYSSKLTLRDGSVRVVANTAQFGTHEAEVAEDQVRLEGDAGSGTLVVEAAAPVGAITIPLPTLIDGVVFEDIDVRRGELELMFSVRDVSLEL
ncbi:MAG TPA: DUF2993 domain-containing protein [Actinomycetota bacterium]|nr:DUF2993 domain-containing protein [Actinomycetota bacterium]